MNMIGLGLLKGLFLAQLLKGSQPANSYAPHQQAQYHHDYHHTYPQPYQHSTLL